MEYLDKEYPNHKYLKSPGILNSMVQILVAEKKEQDEYILQLEKKNAKLTKKASKAEQKLDVCQTTFVYFFCVYVFSARRAQNNYK